MCFCLVYRNSDLHLQVTTRNGYKENETVLFIEDCRVICIYFINSRGICSSDQLTLKLVSTILHLRAVGNS